MVEGAVQRLEEGAAVGAIVRVGNFGNCVIEPLIALGIVTGERRVAGDHYLLDLNAAQTLAKPG
jgi:hypothetical protein